MGVRHESTRKKKKIFQKQHRMSRVYIIFVLCTESIQNAPSPLTLCDVEMLPVCPHKHTQSNQPFQFALYPFGKPLLFYISVDTSVAAINSIDIFTGRKSGMCIGKANGIEKKTTKICNKKIIQNFAVIGNSIQRLLDDDDGRRMLHSKNVV